MEWGRRTYVMGVINVTPDSFSGDGLGSDIQAIVELALRFEEEGADMIDVGAESTRPGSSPISVDEELGRLVPALEAISGRVRVPISVDTYKSQVARHALESGAMIVNDIWGLKADPKIAEVAAEFGAPLVIMHNQKTRKYRDLLPDIRDSLSQRRDRSPSGCRRRADHHRSRYRIRQDRGTQPSGAAASQRISETGASNSSRHFAQVHNRSRVEPRGRSAIGRHRRYGGTVNCRWRRHS